MIIHLRQIQLTGSICFRLQKLIHVAVLGGFNSDLRISRGANQGTRRATIQLTMILVKLSVQAMVDS